MGNGMRKAKENNKRSLNGAPLLLFRWGKAPDGNRAAHVLIMTEVLEIDDSFFDQNKL